MKALSLRQPWAWMVVHGGKTIENRVWKTSFRGEFLIHASGGMTHREYRDARSFAEGVSPRLRRFAIAGRENLGSWPRYLPAFDELDRGGFVGRAKLVDVLDPPRDFSLCREHGWQMPGQFGLVLEEVAAVPFVACPGALSFWNVGEELLRAVGGGE